MTDTQVPAEPTVAAAGLSDLSASLRHRLEEMAPPRDYLARVSIYFPGDPSDSVYWVESGRVKVSRVSRDGRPLTLRHHYPGDMFGEDCMSWGTKRCDHAESMEASRIRCLGGAEFRSLLDTDLEFTKVVLAIVLQRAREMEQVYTETVFRSVRERIAAGLLRLCRTNVPGGHSLRVTHEEVANFVGSTRETTTSVLRNLRESGVVDIGNRRVTVLDLEALRALARQ